MIMLRIAAAALLAAASFAAHAQDQGAKAPPTRPAAVAGIDLAVLKLDDESFFDEHPAQKRAGVLPDVRDAVLAYGCPLGGNSLSITRDIVSPQGSAGMMAIWNGKKA